MIDITTRSQVPPGSSVEAGRALIGEIIGAYRSAVVRAYARIRFLILNQSLLDELEQYLPQRGRVLDLGAGFGLVALYFGGRAPGRDVVGVELNAGRVRAAESAAVRIGLANVRFHAGDVLAWEAAGRYDVITLLDVVHHLPKAEVGGFLERVVGLLEPGGVLLLKEISHRPYWKMLFTLWLDRLMVGMKEPIHYWAPDELTAVLRGLGLGVRRHRMNDLLPYPHILYVVTRPA